MDSGIDDPSMRPGGRRRYLRATLPHTLLSTGRLHIERMAFNNLQQMLHYWAHRLYEAAFEASLGALQDSAYSETRQEPWVAHRDTRQAWSKVAEEMDMVLMLAEGAEVSRSIADTMIHRALDAGREAKAFYMETGEWANGDAFYPWFIPGTWGTGDFDADRAADLAELERSVADRLGVPDYQRKITIELGPHERWY